MSDRHNLFGEPERRSPGQSGSGAEQRPRIPLVHMKDEDDGGGRPPQVKQRKTRLIWAIAADILIAALILLVFYLTNIAPASDQAGGNQPTPSHISQITPSPTQNPTPTPTIWTEPTASPTPSAPATLREKFADKFTTGDVVQTDTSYKSANINVSYQKVQKDGVTYRVEDIYIADVKCFRSAFAQNKFKSGNREFVDAMSKGNKAIAAINGDYCTINVGPVVRDGVNYQTQATWNLKAYSDPKKFRDGDALLLYRDGTMKTLLKGAFTMDDLQDENIWQAYTFGPQLLQDGQPMTEFNSTVANRSNPRTAVGYYEPGHYCFVTVDGRIKTSKGYTMSELSKLFYDLGCKVAFNLDGGGSSQMAFMGKRISDPAPQYRKTSDMLYITDTP